MGALVASFLSFILLYKYVALFIVMFVAALVFPLPSSTSLIAASAFSSQGYLNFYLVLLVGISANIIGDNIGFFLARKFGRNILKHRFFRRLGMSPKLAALENYIQEHPRSTVFFSRFLTEIGPLVNLLAGLSKIPYRQYLLYEASGEIVDVFLYAVAGFVFADKWELAASLFSRSYFVVIAFLVLVFFLRYRNSIKKSGFHGKKK